MRDQTKCPKTAESRVEKTLFCLGWGQGKKKSESLLPKLADKNKLRTGSVRTYSRFKRT